MGVVTERLRSLQQWSPTLFLVAGVLLVGYAALNGIEAFTDVTIEQKLLQFGYVVGFLGLLGLYLPLADRSRWLARAGAAGAVLGAVAFSAFTVVDLAELTGAISGEPPVESIFVTLSVVGFLAGYLLSGVASLRSAVHSRLVGLVLLIPGLIIVLLLVQITTGDTSPTTAFVVTAGQAIAHLAIGTTLRKHTASSDSRKAEPTPDAPVRR